MADMRDIKTTFQLHTNSGPYACPICDHRLLVEPGMPVDFGINHMLSHGYELLHVGSEWASDTEGKTIHHTVAILGKTS